MLNKGLMTSDKNYWETPQSFYEELDKNQNRRRENDEVYSKNARLSFFVFCSNVITFSI